MELAVKLLTVGVMVAAITEGSPQGRDINEPAITNSYLRYDDILRYVGELRKNNQGLVQVKKLGRTFEARYIYVVKLSADFSANKPVVLMEAGMHAREWAGPSLALYAMSRAVHNTSLLQQHDWHIIPVVNPDGYEYTHVHDRFWRKNRRNLGGGCYGVDGNRNFDAGFGKVGFSSDPCAETYPGPVAFSEAESSAVKAADQEVSGRVKAHISIHTYGSKITYPFAYDAGYEPPTSTAMKACVESAKAEMDQYQPNDFQVGNTVQLLGAAGGGSDDWAVAKQNVPFAFTMELPGGGTRGFDLPAEQLEGVLQLSYRGLLRLANCDLLEQIQ